MTIQNDAPEVLLDAVEDEMREQAAIDHYDEAPALKVRRREGARDALEAETGIEPEGGANPS